MMMGCPGWLGRWLMPFRLRNSWVYGCSCSFGVMLMGKIAMEDIFSVAVLRENIQTVLLIV